MVKPAEEYDDGDDVCSDDFSSVLIGVPASVAAANAERIDAARRALGRLRGTWVVRGTWTVSDADGYETLHVAAQHKAHNVLRHLRYYNEGDFWQQASESTKTNSWSRIDK